MRNIQSAKQNIIDATDQCVMCGLCLPHCPTYHASKLEAESPRGRISLVRALHEETLRPSANLVHHLDNCLACMNCLTVCPANVNYEKILDAGREITRHEHPYAYKLKQSLILFCLTNIYARKTIKLLLRIYHIFGFNLLLAKVSIKYPYALRFIQIIPKPANPHFKASTYTNTPNKIRAMLISTCASDIFHDQTIEAAKFVLNKLNCEVVMPKYTHCCGALHQHDGDLKTASILMKKFLTSLTDNEFDVVIPIATGCGAHLNRLPDLIDSTHSQEIAAKLTEINSFVVENIDDAKLEFNPLPEEVWVHQPCTQKLLTKELHAVEKLLSKIPQMKIKIFRDEVKCCGAGGMNALSQAELADALIANKINEIMESNANYLVTSNIGCAMHFQSSLNRTGSAVTICHPITLMAQQLV
ncbi:MAG: (Fe-S)-binding protein [Gammaproteobacteria bacterium]